MEYAIVLHEDAVDPEIVALNEAAKKLPVADSHDGLRKGLEDALYKKHVTSPSDSYNYDARPHVHAVYDKHVVYAHNKKLKMANYHKKADGSIHVGTPTVVQLSYTPLPEGSPAEEAGESAETESRETAMHQQLAANNPDGLEPLTENAVITLSEAAVFAADGTKEVKIVSAGWATSGYYYPKTVLQEQGAQVFPRGTHMYIDHDIESMKRGVARSVKNLAAETVVDAYWSDSGKAGPGLYTRMKPFKPFEPFVEAYAGKIGLSLSAFPNGPITEGEAEGRHGKIVNGFRKSNLTSIDFVSKGGAGGVLPLYESYSEQHQQHTSQENNRMTEQEWKDQIAEANRRNATLLAENFILKTADAKGVKVPQRTLQLLAANPPMRSDGKTLDETALTEALAEWTPRAAASTASTGERTRVENNGRPLNEGATDLDSILKRGRSVFGKLCGFNKETLDYLEER